MGVIHVLRDGSQVRDIKGYVVKEKDARALYNLIHEIQGTTRKTNDEREER